MKQTNTQQKIFVSEYIKTLNAEDAAKNAGYNMPNLKAFSQSLLRRDYIIQEIKKQLKTQISALNIQKGYIVHKLLKIAEFSLEEEEILDKDGNSTGKFKLRDSSAGLKALDGLCKYLGLSEVKNAENTNKFKIITIANLDDKKI